MLYRTRRLSIRFLLRALLARIGSALADMHQTSVDTAGLDGLTERELRELGLDRVTERGETYYR